MTTMTSTSATESAAVGTTSSRTADEIVARLERLPFSRFHLRLASMLGVGTFFDAYDSLVISVALTVVFTSLHISFVNAGLLIGAAYIGQFVGAIVFGYLGERLGRKPAFVLALGLFGLLSLVTAITWDFQSLLIARIVQGVGLGAEVPLAAALFNEYIRGKNRGTVGMLYQSLFFWGLFLAPLFGLGLISALGPDLGWRAAFVVGGIPLLVAFVAHFRLPESALTAGMAAGHLEEHRATLERLLPTLDGDVRRLAAPDLLLGFVIEGPLVPDEGTDGDAGEEHDGGAVVEAALALHVWLFFWPAPDTGGGHLSGRGTGRGPRAARGAGTPARPWRSGRGGGAAPATRRVGRCHGGGRC
jgi:MFS family permease